MWYPTFIRNFPGKQPRIVVKKFSRKSEIWWLSNRKFNPIHSKIEGREKFNQLSCLLVQKQARGYGHFTPFYAIAWRGQWFTLRLPWPSALPQSFLTFWDNLIFSHSTENIILYTFLNTLIWRQFDKNAWNKLLMVIIISDFHNLLS